MIRPLIVASFAFLGSCSRPPFENEAIARVNGHVITVREFTDAFSYLKPKDLSLTGTARLETKNIVIKSLIRRSVILTAAEKSGVQITEAELEAGLKKFKEGYTNTSFEQSLLEQMVDADEWKSRVKQNLLIEKLFDGSAPKLPAPSEKQALQYYQDHPNLYHKEATATALHLVVVDQKLAEDLRQKIKAKPKSFKLEAKKNSIGPEAQEDATIRVTEGTLPPELDRFLFQSKIGELSPVIKTNYGYHILQVTQRKHAINLDFEQVRDEIYKSLLAENRRKWLLDFEEDLIRKAQIEYNRELIERI